MTEQELVERVAVILQRVKYVKLGGSLYPLAEDVVAAVRAHDAGMPCGHCDPGVDEVRCACEIEESHDEL